MNIRKVCAHMALAFGVAVGSAPAMADVTSGGLTLDTDPTTFYQQTAASPCVIGGNNCLNGSFPYTLVGSGGAGTTDSATSPSYLLADIYSLLGGNSFMIGLDYNDTADPQNLNQFTASYYNGATLVGSQNFQPAGGVSLKTTNNGVGYSDFILSGFAPTLDANRVVFYANWFNNDGPDRYFLIGQNTPTTVSEPGTLALLGLGALGLGLVSVRRKSAKKA